MVCRLFGAKPLSNPNAGVLSIGKLESNFSEILIKIQNFPLTKKHLKNRLRNGDNFAQGEMV